MKIVPLDLPGAFQVELELVADERGHFARTFCQEEFRLHGLDPTIAQCNISWNPRRGTLRGMHYQTPPHEECKLIRCTRGAVFDVLVDLRRDSPTFCQWVGQELLAGGPRMLFAPKGVAHGFLTLADRTEVQYQMSAPYVAGTGRGVRWNDAVFGIKWPASVEVISAHDATFSDFTP
jgi:dTDP-4-dehydrorhamnose 3,5-epimerase